MYSIFVVVCCKVWTLGVWGELACHKRLFNPPPQFSRLGTWCPTFLCASVCLVCVFGWRDGGWRVTSFFFFFFFCYLFYLASMLYTYFSCTLYSTWCIMICLVIPILSQSLYSLSKFSIYLLYYGLLLPCKTNVDEFTLCLL